MKTLVTLLSVVFISLPGFSLETPRTKSYIQIQVEVLDQGFRAGQITDETKDFFITSLKQMQSAATGTDQNPTAEFIAIVQEGLQQKKFSAETKEFFQQALFELTQNLGQSK